MALKMKNVNIMGVHQLWGNQDTYFFVIMNNRLKIFSVHAAPL